MPIRYLPVDQAIPHPSLRMVVVGNVPSPWAILFEHRDRLCARHLELPLSL